MGLMLPAGFIDNWSIGWWNKDEENWTSGGAGGGWPYTDGRANIRYATDVGDPDISQGFAACPGFKDAWVSPTEFVGGHYGAAHGEWDFWGNVTSGDGSTVQKHCDDEDYVQRTTHGGFNAWW